MPLNEVFAALPHQAAIDTTVLGAWTLPNEAITARYDPGEVSSVVSAGDNPVQFTYAGAAGGSFIVVDTAFEITYEDASVLTFWDTTGAVNETVDEATSVTRTIPVTEPPFLDQAASVSLRMTLADVESVEEAVILVNGRGPYVPSQAFVVASVGDPPKTDRLFLPSLQPLRVTATITWTTQGRSMTQLLTTARD